MKTNSFFREDGSMCGFEFPHTWVRMATILAILRSVPGVEGVHRTWFNEHRVRFRLDSESFVVWEPWGDNSWYWVGPIDDASHVDLTAILAAFDAHETLPDKLMAWRRRLGRG